MALAVIPGLGSVGPMELLILLTIILLLFGAKRIPELAKGLGTGIRGFRKGTSGQDEKDELNEKEKEGALTGGAGEDSSRMHEETAREERDSDRAEERERVDQGAKRAEQNL
jgi:sec-independent protein translocase protein TatA